MLDIQSQSLRILETGTLFLHLISLLVSVQINNKMYDQ